ncbi:DNA polymerase delta subunit 3 isoform X2 [Stegostoma tigrinum]|uniref:DNA polymerase delta subunit 3 isoform X2 n=1 Tax=Stegostoma tigrinum TaxID=3053191 RepID=UPI00202B0CF9|nr:DNA polymerase delta subunit 3 isoform X2 [Stegostoma tigrinum]
MMEELELLLENIEELVADENRIVSGGRVTYKMLSQFLGIHVNQAKQMLYYYVERKRKENSGAQLHVTYLVSGKAVENGISCHKVAVVREDQLEAMKVKMLVTASVHVYSIQKAMLKDSSPLFNTDYEAIKENLQNSNKYSAIQCAGAVPRSAEEMARLQKSVQQSSWCSNEMDSSSKPVVNGNLRTAPKNVPQQPKGIMGMFSAKSTAKTQDKEVKGEPVVVKDTETAAPSGTKTTNKGNSFTNFFLKASAKKGSSPFSQATEEEDFPAKSTQENPEKGDTPSVEDSTVKPVSDSDRGGDGERSPTSMASAQKSQANQEKIQTKKDIANKQQKDGQSKKTKRNVPFTSEEQEPCNKRRRRIRQPQSDSSDDEVIPDSPEACTIRTPSPSPEEPTREEDTSLQCLADIEIKPQRWENADGSEKAVGVKRRKRRRVLKSKMFLDEEGAMVTEKVYQSESCTDSEDEFVAKQQESKNLLGPKPTTTKCTLGSKDQLKEHKDKKASASSRAGRQASIMGFFKKAV